MSRRNSRIVLVQEGAVALMWCRDHGEEFYCFPGGGVEEGETLEQAAAREAFEELGVEVSIGRCVASFAHQRGEIGYFFEAQVVGGVFGAGTGPEYTPGVYPGVEVRPCWISVAELAGHVVRPWQVARSLASGRLGMADEPLHFADDALGEA